MHSQQPRGLEKYLSVAGDTVSVPRPDYRLEYVAEKLYLKVTVQRVR